jgi:hypothetical protein
MKETNQVDRTTTVQIDITHASPRLYRPMKSHYQPTEEDMDGAFTTARLGREVLVSAPARPRIMVGLFNIVDGIIRRYIHFDMSRQPIEEDALL